MVTAIGSSKLLNSVGYSTCLHLENEILLLGVCDENIPSLPNSSWNLITPIEGAKEATTESVSIFSSTASNSLFPDPKRTPKDTKEMPSEPPNLFFSKTPSSFLQGTANMASKTTNSIFSNSQIGQNPSENPFLPSKLTNTLAQPTATSTVVSNLFGSLNDKPKAPQFTADIFKTRPIDLINDSISSNAPSIFGTFLQKSLTETPSLPLPEKANNQSSKATEAPSTSNSNTESSPQITTSNLFSAVPKSSYSSKNIFISKNTKEKSFTTTNPPTNANPKEDSSKVPTVTPVTEAKDISPSNTSSVINQEIKSVARALSTTAAQEQKLVKPQKCFEKLIASKSESNT